MSVARSRMTADEFLVWAEPRPEGRRWELVAGEPLAMAPELVTPGLDSPGNDGPESGSPEWKGL